MGASDRPDGAHRPQAVSRRLAVFGAVGILVVAIGHFSGDLPAERQIEVRVTDPAVDRVQLSWKEGDEVLHRTTLAAPFGASRSAVQLSNGNHKLDISVRRGDDVRTKTRVIEVFEGSDHIVIDVP